ncbi:hypothetical protein [Methylobacterium aerolatum]|uniref:Uncharacterized protein n=1 Tax=Methylobacterium aerolatum TaxID=418708 RepID=A0ABU0HX99_9HYPH|nr:hypothetical protein [Methylobacterium aerolatum]MDQ0446964.1 hypothetical protein [Methylobacterium aerolatum]GJD37021.1 hypothetical protein FMGBMHLM_3947 [Methylobacterium aerolatum]
MRRPFTAVALLAAVLAPRSASAAQTIPYGSRIAMEVTVTEMNGIGTDRAVIHVVHTAAMARRFCVDYANDRSARCVRDTLNEPGLKTVLRGNCRSGAFTTLYGEAMTFKGRNPDREEGAPRYRIEGAKGTLDGSYASGYPEILAQFRALCPALVDSLD